MTTSVNQGPSINGGAVSHLSRPKPGDYDQDLEWVARCRAGDESAVTQLVERFSGMLRAVLIRRGAGPNLAEDLVADLWGDCFGARQERSGLLAKYSGRSSLGTWLATVLTHRWLDQVRRNRKNEPAGLDKILLEVGAHDPSSRESKLTTLLRNALCQAFANCDPEALIMLQLVYLHDISQRDLAMIWGVSEFKICRQLAKAKRQIRAEALERVNGADPLLRLDWVDFVELCSDTEFPWIRSPKAVKHTGKKARKNPGH